MKLSVYQGMCTEMFASVGQAIGIHVLLLVIEHALWQTKQKYEEASLITFSEEGVSLCELENIDTEKADLIAHDFVMAIVFTLSRLVGKQLAQQLTEQLQISGRNQ
jgi:malonyl CoA-acyl carrier protein transacylase